MLCVSVRSVLASIGPPSPLGISLSMLVCAPGNSGEGLSLFLD